MEATVSAGVPTEGGGVSVQANGLDLAAIHPGKGGRFSPHLHSWLTMRGSSHGWTSRVYVDASGVLWIGMLDNGDLFGARLMNVLCYGVKAERACWAGLRGLVEVQDFWQRYSRDGRCAIDTTHTKSFLGDDARWDVKGDTRTCLWCGKGQQVLARWTETVVRSEWRTVPE